MRKRDESGKKIYFLVETMCDSLGIKMKDVERGAGLANGYMYKLRQGLTPSADKINAIAKYFDVTSDFLLGGVSSFNNGKNGSGVRIPLVGKLEFGVPATALQNVIGEEIVSDKLAGLGECFAIQVPNDANAPVMQKGDRAIVAMCDRVEDGSCGLFLFKVGTPRLGFIFRANSYVMIVYRSGELTPDIFPDESYFCTIGQVVEIRRTI